MVEPPDDDVTRRSDPVGHDVAGDGWFGGRPEPDAVERLSGRGATDDHDRALADLRAEMSIDDLRRRRAERDRSLEEMTTRDTLARSVGRTVTAWVSTGGTMTGQVAEIGADYVCMSTTENTVWISIREIAAVRSAADPGAPAASTGGPDARLVDARLVDVIQDLILSEVTIILTIRGGAQISGTPTTVGPSVTLVDDRGNTTVNVDAIVIMSQLMAKSPGGRTVHQVV